MTPSQETTRSPGPADGPIVTLLIPTYNCGHLIGEALASVRAQTWRNLDVVVVDDGSTDDTAARLAPFEAHGELRILRVAHGGLAAARNAGIRAALGKYIAFLDADDTLDPDAVRVAVEAMEAAPEAGICLGDVVRVYPDRTELRPGPPPPGDLFTAILQGNFVERVALFRTPVFREVGLYDESLRILEDWELYIRVFSKGVRPVYVPGPGYRYMLRADSLTRDLAVMASSKRQVLARHHRPLAEEGRPGMRATYADQMWWLARMYYYQLHRPGAALLCLIEGFRFDPDPRRLLRTFHTQVRGTR